MNFIFEARTNKQDGQTIIYAKDEDKNENTIRISSVLLHNLVHKRGGKERGEGRGDSD